MNLVWLGQPVIMKKDTVFVQEVVFSSTFSKVHQARGLMFPAV